MTREELNQEIAFLSDTNTTKQISIYVTTANDDIRLFNIVQVDLDELLTRYLSLIDEIIINREDLSIGNYSTSISRDNMIYLYDLGQEAYTKEMKNMVAAGTNMNPDLFVCDESSLEKIDGWYVVINDSQHRLVLYKQVIPVDITYGSKSYYFGCKHDNSIFERKKDSLIRVTPGIQMMYIDDRILLIDMKRLEKSLGLNAILQKEANRIIDMVSQKGFVEDTTKLKEVCKKPSLLKKLNHALFESKTKDMSKDAILKYLKEESKVKFKFNEKEDMLLLDTKAASERFIKLLDDDYLYSKMTDTEYVSVQKDIFIQQED